MGKALLSLLPYDFEIEKFKCEKKLLEGSFRTGNFISKKSTKICALSTLYSTVNKLKYIETNRNSSLTSIMANKSLRYVTFMLCAT